MADDKASGTASGTQWDNPTHQLYLHHLDQPGAILVPQPLVEDNYSTWKQSMTMALTVKNKIGLVDGSIEEPSGKNLHEWQQWNRCNNLVQTWLLGSMSKDIASSVINCKNARQIWMELQERFSHVNVVQLFNIENEIHDCVQRGMSVGSYFTKLKGLWDARDALCTFPICTCGSVKELAAYLDTQKTMKFLMGLNDSYASVRSNTLLQDPFPTVNKAYSLVLRHEKQSENANRESEGEKDELKCTKCNKTNHTAKTCQAHLKCAFCGWKGYTAEYCSKKKAAVEAVLSKGNQAATCLTDRKEMKFPFTAEECKQILSMLHNKSSSANHVSNPATHEELSGPTFGNDDWDGN
ncbi:uncharacterized protein [Pyrus communis]|uniref:uncharacterized protein n=1 Tax=Pyrus communis TaxID=23211 RepID=UPI0035BF7CCD